MHKDSKYTTEIAIHALIQLYNTCTECQIGGEAMSVFIFSLFSTAQFDYYQQRAKSRTGA